LGRPSVLDNRGGSHFRHETVALPGYGLDVLSFVSAVTQGAPKLSDDVFDRTDLALTAPDVLKKLGFRHDPMSVLDEILKRGEWLGGNLDLFIPAVKRPQVEIQAELADPQKRLIRSARAWGSWSIGDHLSPFSALLQRFLDANPRKPFYPGTDT
jgi:hypothetical protein